MSRSSLPLLVYLLFCGTAAAEQLPIVVDAQKDSFYLPLTGPADGRFHISHADFLPRSGPAPRDDADCSAEVWAAWDTNTAGAADTRALGMRGDIVLAQQQQAGGAARGRHRSTTVLKITQQRSSMPREPFSKSTVTKALSKMSGTLPSYRSPRWFTSAAAEA